MRLPGGCYLFNSPFQLSGPNTDAADVFQFYWSHDWGFAYQSLEDTIDYLVELGLIQQRAGCHVRQLHVCQSDVVCAKGLADTQKRGSSSTAKGLLHFSCAYISPRTLSFVAHSEK